MADNLMREDSVISVSENYRSSTDNILSCKQDNYKINGSDLYFEDGFDEYSHEQKLKIIKAVEIKYLDWDIMINRKYENMRNTFEESGISKLCFIMTDERFNFKYPELTDDTLRFTVILGALGKGSKHPGYYHQCIGKFNIHFG